MTRSRRRRRKVGFITDRQVRKAYNKADAKIRRSRIPSGAEVDAILRRAKPLRLRRSPRRRKNEIIAGLEDIL